VGAGGPMFTPLALAPPASAPAAASASETKVEIVLANGRRVGELSRAEGILQYPGRLVVHDHLEPLRKAFASYSLFSPAEISFAHIDISRKARTTAAARNSARSRQL